MTGAERARARVLWLSTAGFTLAFAVWTMFGILGIPIRKEFGLSDTQLGWLLAAAVLGGSLPRLLFGVLADRHGGGKVFTALLLATAPGALLVSQAHSYPELVLYALWTGLAGNTFSIGIAWCSAWFPAERQGFALGVFGAGNVGASVTKFIGPALITLVPAGGLWSGALPGGWRFVPVLYALLLVAMAALIWLFLPRPDRRPGSDRSFTEMLRPLQSVRVWRFGLYYVVVFGAYVALSLWLPKYYVDTFGLPLGTAALLTALFIFPASLLRPLGGWASDALSARPVMYWTLGATTALALPLSLPGIVTSPWWFTLAVVSIGICMGIGKAAVYKFIPQHFPGDVGAVGGQVGLLGALGGFVLPPLFGYTTQLTGVPETTFLALFLLSGASLVWLHATVQSMLRAGVQVTPHTVEHSPEPGHGIGADVPSTPPSPRAPSVPPSR
ncbi:MAG: nitrate/nitrite transporter [Halobacteria archaeon]